MVGRPCRSLPERPSSTHQPACKPGSVGRRGFYSARDGHSSGATLARGLKQPTRAAGPDKTGRSLFRAAPIRFCSRWGLPCRSRCRSRGALLPHRFTLARSPKEAIGGLFSVALSLGLPPPDVIRHRMSKEPGLSSTAAFRRLPQRPSSRLTPAREWGRKRAASRVVSARLTRPRGGAPVVWRRARVWEPRPESFAPASNKRPRRATCAALAGRLDSA